MGAASVIPSLEQQRVPTVHGSLNITIKKALIQSKDNVFQVDPYLIVKMTNQSYTTKIMKTREPIFNEKTSFFVNSCFQKYGRMLIIELWDKRTLDANIGVGIIDLDEILQKDKMPQDLKVYLSKGPMKVGFVQITLEFQKCGAQTISFRFEEAFLRKKSSKIGVARCTIKVEIGEEVLETRVSEDLQTSLPEWRNCLLTFEVPVERLEKGILRVMDRGEEIGSLPLNILEILASKEKEIKLDEEYRFHEVELAGLIKLSIFKGQQPEFTQSIRLRSVYVSMKPPEDTKVQKVTYNGHPELEKATNSKIEQLNEELLKKKRELEGQQQLQNIGDRK